MPLPSPKKDQDKNSFVSDCMSDPKMKKEFPNHKRRLAVCHSQQKRRESQSSTDLAWVDWDFEENQYYIWW